MLRSASTTFNTGNSTTPATSDEVDILDQLVGLCVLNKVMNAIPNINNDPSVFGALVVNGSAFNTLKEEYQKVYRLFGASNSARLNKCRGAAIDMAKSMIALGKAIKAADYPKPAGKDDSHSEDPFAQLDSSN